MAKRIKEFSCKRGRTKRKKLASLSPVPYSSPLARKQELANNFPTHGWIAQSVEQRTENPRVAGSIPAPATPLDYQRLTSIDEVEEVKVREKVSKKIRECFIVTTWYVESYRK